ncbi:MAG: hypothetical protein RLZZ15_819 [Verrucomicrobiota bacterium]|jgi:hypothetical protein
MSTYPQPYRPLASAALADWERHIRIRPLEISACDAYRQGIREVVTESSSVAFCFLREIAEDGKRVTILRHHSADFGVMAADAESLAALNSYLRTARVGRGGLPFRYVWGEGVNSRWQWSDFCAHLGLNFVPDGVPVSGPAESAVSGPLAFLSMPPLFFP